MPQPLVIGTERELELCASYTAGNSLDEVAAKFNVSVSWILTLLRKHNVTRRRAGTSKGGGLIYERLNDADKAEALAMRGLPRKLKPTWSEIRKHFEAKGVEFSGIDPIPAKAKRFVDLDIELARVMYLDQRQSLRRVAEKLGVSVPTIRGAFARHGIAVRTGREALSA